MLSSSAEKFDEKASDGAGDLPQSFTVDEEDERLRELGIRRELRKEFTNFTAFSFAVGISGYARVFGFLMSRV